MNVLKFKHPHDAGLFIIRVGLGLIFIKHGFPKLMGGTESWQWLGSQMAHLGITFAPQFWGFVGATASHSDISFQSNDDMVGGNPAFVPVRERDLDFRTGSSRSGLTNRGSANVYFYFGCDNQYYAGLGGHVEITQKNTALSTWAVWLNVGHRI